MTRKGKSTDEIILALREPGVRLGQGETVGKICRRFAASTLGYRPPASSRDPMVKIADSLP